MTFASRCGPFIRAPSFTVTAVLSLMLGIGATTAIYSLVDQVAAPRASGAPARASRTDRLERRSSRARVWQLESDVVSDLPRSGSAEADFRRRLLPRAHAGQSHDGWRSSARDRGDCIRQLFSSPRRAAGVGDACSASEDDGAPNANPVIVVSYDFWKTKLGGASDVVGRKLLVNSHPMTVDRRGR